MKTERKENDMLKSSEVKKSISTLFTLW